MEIFPFFHSLGIFLFSEIVIFMINWKFYFVSFNSVRYHTRDQQIGLPLRGRPILLPLEFNDYRPNWSPLSPITISNHTRNKQIGLPLRGRPSLLSLDYRPNGTPLSPITITNR